MIFMLLMISSLNMAFLLSRSLQAGLMEEIKDIAKKYANDCDLSKIPCRSLWRHKGRL